MQAQFADLGDGSLALVVGFLGAAIDYADAKYGEALEAADRVVEAARRVGESYLEARSHLLASAILLRLGKYTEAERHCEAALYLSVWRVNDRNLEGDSLSNLGLVHKNLGMLSEAERNFRRAIDAFSATGEQLRKIRTGLNLRHSGHRGVVFSPLEHRDEFAGEWKRRR